MASAFQIRNTGLEGFARRIAAARVFVSLMLTGRRLLESGGEKTGVMTAPVASSRY